MPPLYHRVWQYLKYKVNHEDNEIPMRDGSRFLIKKGQHLTSVRDIAKNIGWYEGAKRKEPNPKTISTILDWLVKQSMISIERGKGNRQYTLITLINWEIYQLNESQGNSKVTVDGAGSKHLVDINKNDKECLKNDKEITTTNKNDLGEIFEPKLKDETSPKDDVDLIADRFIDLRTVQSGRMSIPNTKDYEAIAQIVALGVPTSITIKLLEQCFMEYNERSPGKEITSFRYCMKYISDKWEDMQARDRAKDVKAQPNAFKKNVKKDKLPEWIANQEKHEPKKPSKPSESEQQKRERLNQLKRELGIEPVRESG